MLRWIILPLLALALTDAHSTDPEMDETTPQIVMRWDYPAMIYTAETSDGYILELHRIPYGKTNVTFPGGKRPVVFLQHGLECDSSNWVSNLPEQSAGFILADAGFDVWMGNMRGNTYSKKHKNLKSSHEAFWKFSWDEMAEHDLPAMIDKVLSVTGAESVYYMGHSQGTLTMFSKLSEDQEFAKKIRKFFALAPVGQVKNIKGMLKFLADYFSPEFDLWYDVFGSGEFTPNNWIMKLAADAVCAGLKVENDLCDQILFLIAGPESSQFNATRVPIYIAHTPAGTSTQNVVHWLQMVRHGGTPKHDFGSKENKKKYGQAIVPAYDFTNIKMDQIYLYWGDQDWLGDPTDIESFLIPRLDPNNVKANVKLTDYNHLDFIWGLRAADDIYRPVAKIITDDFLGS